MGIKDDPSFGELIDAVGTQLESAAHVLGADEGSHSELEEQPRRGRIPVIEWLDETVNALNDETPFRLRFLAVGDELDVELDWQEGSGTSLRAACLLDQLEHLAEQLVIDGNGKISAADLVPVAHRSKLPDIGQLLNTVPLESVPQMLALAAEAHPLRSAVEHGTRSWSYGKFDEVVRRIAGALYAAGARRCDVIAVTGERSCALVASMAAVLRAGGVLLCLDQNLPAGRRELMLREAKVCAILVIGDRRARVHRWARSYRRSRRDAVSRSRSGIHLRLSNWRRSGLHLLHLWNDRCAEGVLGVHAGLSHFIAWQRKAFDIGSGDRAAQLTGLSFDVVLRDVHAARKRATLVIPDSSDVLLIA